MPSDRSADDGRPTTSPGADTEAGAETGRTEPIKIAVYICTHRRNGPLARMLDSLEVAGRLAAPAVELGVVVIDDNDDGRAKEVVDHSTRSFPLGLHYRFVGAGNIATARNAGLEAAMEIGHWVGMVDDDQVVVPNWLIELFAVQQRTGADAVTAPVYPRFPDSAPRFLTEQGFADLWGTIIKEDGCEATDLQTANSIIRSSFLAEHPSIRFSTDLGKVGGEDMVFYRAALDAGLKAHYSLEAVNWEYYEGVRATWRYQLRRSLWMGNTEAVTELRAGRANRGRLLARAVKRTVTSLVLDPLARVRAGEPPRMRYALTYAVQPLGILIGMAGIRLAHA